MSANKLTSEQETTTESNKPDRNWDAKRQEAHQRLADAIAEHAEGKELAGVVCLFSGGNDSSVVLDVMRPHLTHIAHANTGIGIEETREHVRKVAADEGLPLLEEHGESYRDLVIERGFPGPAMHYKMYQRLKERALRKVRKRLVSNGRKQRVVFLSGIRNDESKRRAGRPVSSREGSVVWVCPLIDWTNEEMAAYRESHDLPRNEVSDHLHMSGECLCGSFAKPGELDMIRMFYPSVAAEIDELQVEVAAAGNAPVERHCWGWGAYRGMTPDEISEAKASLIGTLCETCTVGWQEEA